MPGRRSCKAALHHCRARSARRAKPGSTLVHTLLTPRHIRSILRPAGLGPDLAKACSGQRNAPPQNHQNNEGSQSMKRRSLIKAFTLSASIVAMGLTWTVQAAETIKVGILHSLSGTMAISETSLKDMALMTIDEINAKGGVNGKMLEAVVVDPASNWPLFAEKGRQLLTQDKVAVVFGCWTSVSRKSVLPVFEELNGLLFYPVQYEGEEMSPNVFYTGAAPNQQAIPAVEYVMSEDGGSAKRFFLLGTDYVYPRTTNKILRAFLHSKGVADKDIEEVYTPFGHSDYQTIVANIKKFSAGGKTAVISTVNGDSNVPFYKELANQGLKATDVPVVAFSVGEEELRGIDTKPLVGHLAAWNYFQSVENPVNKKFVADWKAYAQKKNLPGADKAVTNDPMEATYVGIHMWAQAVEKAKSTDVDKVREAMAGQTFAAPSGFTLTMDKTNHHLHKPVMIGEVEDNGQFNVVWQTKEPIRAQPWSPYIPGNDKKPDTPVKSN
ncbi:Branched-chain amino acid ABC transporter, periplasmic amino acid-binding protein [Pseudomonas syringae pv. berberidis]|nr:Branched-chain amino acid ABC transporter, periplasmic amino acid-binding protein [Pseudomonas syringae pv. berberidis]RMQ27435.1 Branched-chain amino acid ABC transporter, periplasmic amino acid-binding protein [Pseudomonas syringae pv. berberidis]